MKKKLLSILTIIIVMSCSSKKGNLTITGNIDGLKKGTIYLQKVKDSMLISIDSVVVDGNSEFIMSSDLKEPEIYYLYLDKKDGTQFNDRIDFFAEPGEMTIYTTLKDFEEDVKITGGKNEMKRQEFKKINDRFKERNLRLVTEEFNAKKRNDDETLIQNEVDYRKLLKRKYLYTINFAMNNKNLEIAPYITLKEASSAQVKYLDTVANALNSKIKKSLYGKQLIEYIKERKTKEAL